MKIVFIGLASTFTPGMSYQDNELCRQTVADGHQVTYISNPEKFVNGEIVPTGYEDTILPDGMRLIRLPYCWMGTHLMTVKFRKFKGVYEILEQTKPDLIYCHNTQYWSILDVIRYKKNHPEVRLLADIHTAEDNSGTNWLSLHVLHRIYYRYLTQKLLPHVEKLLYIGELEGKFAAEQYKVPESLLEFYPLGGTPFSEEEHAEKRQRRRAELGVKEDELLLVHAGKLEPKKKTEMLLRAFAAVPELKARLVVIGSIPQELRGHLLPLMEQDSRVAYLGWKSADELMEYLCASDLYVQPGKVSAIMQNAVCCGCPILSYPHSSYKKLFDYKNFIWAENEEELIHVFQRLAAGEYDLAALRYGSERCARELLDYRVLAKRLY